MQTLHFAILPYRSADNTISENYVYLALVNETESVVERECVPTYRWEANEDDFQSYWKRVLITRIYKKLSNYTSWQAEYTLSKEDYEDWYHWYFFIDGEDAREYISACGHTQHSTNFQSVCGVTIGWKYFKVLKEHSFQTSTAAMLAYARGYLAGMELNSPWDREGSEALMCLDLTVAKGTHLTE